MTGTPIHPIAVGGIGGSGTRLIASLLQAFGYHLGDDLNDYLDNQWFTLLFKRRSILVEGPQHLWALFELFAARMSGAAKVSDDQRRLVAGLANQDRIQHDSVWLAERLASLLDGTTTRGEGQPWGWKEPSTHVVIGQLLELNPDLRYIHVLRDPFYLSYSSNQNQLENWGPLYLDRDIEIGPRQSLSYWCALHRRIVQVTERWPGRTMLVDYENFCRRPLFNCGRISGFLNAAIEDEALSRFLASIRRPADTEPPTPIDPGQFDPEDLAYVATLGYRP